MGRAVDISQKLNAIRKIEKFIQMGGFIGTAAEEKCRIFCEECISQITAPVPWNIDKQGIYRKIDYEQSINSTIFQYKTGCINSMTDESSEFIRLLNEIVEEMEK